MGVQQAVWTETRKIAIGVSILSVIMILAFVGLGYFDYTVILGAVLGSIAAIGNFFFMAMTVQRIAESMHGVKKNKPQYSDMLKNDKEEQSKDNPADDLEELDEEPLTPEEEADLKEQTAHAKRTMQASFGLRMLFMGGVALIGMKVSCFQPVAVLIPFLFPRVVIMVNSWLNKSVRE